LIRKPGRVKGRGLNTGCVSSANLTQFHINQKCCHSTETQTQSWGKFPFKLESNPLAHLGANRISIVEMNCELNEVLKFECNTECVLLLWRRMRKTCQYVVVILCM